jgi:hypothetical protein
VRKIDLEVWELPNLVSCPVKVVYEIYWSTAKPGQPGTRYVGDSRARNWQLNTGRRFTPGVIFLHDEPCPVELIHFVDEARKEPEWVPNAAIAGSDW